MCQGFVRLRTRYESSERIRVFSNKHFFSIEFVLFFLRKRRGTGVRGGGYDNANGAYWWELAGRNGERSKWLFPCELCWNCQWFTLAKASPPFFAFSIFQLQLVYWSFEILSNWAYNCQCQNAACEEEKSLYIRICYYILFSVIISLICNIVDIFVNGREKW